ncbi:MAG: Ktr system potassium uptake protein A [Syntrophorhabdus sp. PtaB.Bin184]|jgi:trk system potassium uptake protein TrkA|nr:MAG: Ktr system potassium uptake protein A [Syntrophorhabdus sp. PtaB.Bin184]
MKRVVVIGIGIFGFNLVKELFENGMEVIAIDKNKDMVQEIADFSTKAIVSDGLEKNVLESLGLRENDVVVVSFGEDLAASTLITLHLKQMRIRNIIVKAPNVEYKQVLESVGATEVIIPEKEMASKVARSLISPNILDYIPLAEDYIIGEIAPPVAFQGKTLAEVHLRSRHNINVIAIRDTLTDTVRMVPPHYVIKDSEILIVIGKSRDIDRIQ